MIEPLDEQDYEDLIAIFNKLRNESAEKNELINLSFSFTPSGHIFHSCLSSAMPDCNQGEEE